MARLPFELLPEDLVIARGPGPPAATGFPTPSLVCNSLALRVRGGGMGGGLGDGSLNSLDGRSSRSSFSSSGSCIIMDVVRLGPAFGTLCCRIETDLRGGSGGCGCGGG